MMITSLQNKVKVVSWEGANCDYAQIYLIINKGNRKYDKQQKINEFTF